MADVTLDTLKGEIVEELTAELSGDEDFSETILTAKVNNAIREVKMKRNYVATSYTDAQVAEDLYNYFSVIKSVALYDYNQAGAEGEQSHSENSVSRTWTSRDDLFKGVHAFVKIL